MGVIIHAVQFIIILLASIILCISKLHKFEKCVFGLYIVVAFSHIPFVVIGSTQRFDREGKIAASTCLTSSGEFMNIYLKSNYFLGGVLLYFIMCGLIMICLKKYTHVME